MTTRGDLRALVGAAPGGLSTVQAGLTTWLHRERAAAARARSGDASDDLSDDEQPEERAGGSAVDVVRLPAALADDDARDDLGAMGEAVAPDSTADSPRADPPDEGPEIELSWYVVVALPDRWRVVGRGQLAVCDGRLSWAGTSTLVTERDATRATLHDAGVIGALLDPAGPLRGFELVDVGTGEIEGRSCRVADAVPGAEPAERVRGGTERALGALPLHRDLVGVEHRLWIDAATGIVLRHEGSIDGATCAITEVTDLVIDEDVPDDQFRPPPGAVVRSHHELLRDHLDSLGVDPDGVDLDDPASVRAALRGR